MLDFSKESVQIKLLAESCSQIHTYISQLIDTIHQIQVLQSCWLQCEYFTSLCSMTKRISFPKEGSTSALFLCLLMKHCLLWHEAFVIKSVVSSSSPQTRLKFNLLKIKKYLTILNITRHNIISEFPIILGCPRTNNHTEFMGIVSLLYKINLRFFFLNVFSLYILTLF